MRGVESIGDLTRNRERVGYRRRSALDPIGQRFAFHQLEHQGADAIGFFEAVDGADVGVIERGEHARLAFEASQAFWMVRETRAAGS